MPTLKHQKLYNLNNKTSFKTRQRFKFILATKIIFGNNSEYVTKLKKKIRKELTGLYRSNSPGAVQLCCKIY